MAGFICAPLILPTRESPMRQPMVPNKKPEISLSTQPGINGFKIEPLPQLNITMLNPAKHNAAVPINSAQKSGSRDLNG